jgi:hypothetical protein
MERCSCGVELRQFWIWRDVNQIAHASAFPPSVPADGPFYAANPRDAAALFQAGRSPRHDVFDANSGERRWIGHELEAEKQVAS